MPELSQPAPLPGGAPCVPGVVYLVGAGPGDPDLLTCRALRLLQSAEVVLHDALVSAQVRALSPQAQLISVGKRSGAHRTSQQQIQAQLVHHAQAGARVVRLKGGDPMVFGRAGEEMEALRAAGVPYQVVPGVSASLASGALSGIPLTLRGQAGALTIVTGHAAARGASDVDWAAVSSQGGTLLVMMGLARLPEICAQLMSGGRCGSTPVAVIQAVSTPGQRSVVGTLADIAQRVREQGVVAPATVIVGAVAALQERLSWRQESAGEISFEGQR